MKLVIFDLDQTLVDFSAVHEDVTHQLFRDVFNVDARLTEIDFSGKSLTDNLYELARLKGVSEANFITLKKDILAKYETLFQQKIPQNSTANILPGVRTLLQKVIETGHFTTLYTGDSRRIVDTVLSSTGLGQFFQSRVYGTESESRLDMAKLAIKNAEEMTGRKFKDKNVVIIGDSIRDIECGNQLGALIIAVASGFHSIDDLKAQKPDYIFNDLVNTNSILQAIG